MKNSDGTYPDEPVHQTKELENRQNVTQIENVTVNLVSFG